MTGTSSNSLTLIHEAIDGFREPYRFEVGERCWVRIPGLYGNLQFIEGEVVAISGGRASSNGFIYQVGCRGMNLTFIAMQYDLLKFDIDVESV